MSIPCRNLARKWFCLRDGYKRQRGSGRPVAQWSDAMLDPIASRLEQYMDLLSARQKLVASNIANADTPGYKTKDLDFQSEFRNLIDGADPTAVEVAGLTTRNDGNNVSLDREARLLAENALRFTVASNLLRSEIRAVRAAIQGGKNT
jgi:flagellar basal-body rod protein FlgB